MKRSGFGRRSATSATWLFVASVAGLCGCAPAQTVSTLRSGGGESGTFQIDAPFNETATSFVANARARHQFDGQTKMIFINNMVIPETTPGQLVEVMPGSGGKTITVNVKETTGRTFFTTDLEAKGEGTEVRYFADKDYASSKNKGAIMRAWATTAPDGACHE